MLRVSWLMMLIFSLRLGDRFVADAVVFIVVGDADVVFEDIAGLEFCARKILELPIVLDAEAAAEFAVGINFEPIRERNFPVLFVAEAIDDQGHGADVKVIFSEGF